MMNRLEAAGIPRVRIVLAATAAAVASIVPNACGLIAGPDKAVENYLRAGADDDLASAAGYLDEGCTDESMKNVDSVKVLGAPMKLESLEVEVVETAGDTATVDWSAKGSVDAKNATAEVFGMKVEVQGVSVGEMTKSGTFILKKKGLSWKITCP